MTFSDVNEERFLYIIEDHKIVETIKNVTTPMFKRVYNDDIFILTDSRNIATEKSGSSLPDFFITAAEKPQLPR